MIRDCFFCDSLASEEGCEDCDSKLKHYFPNVTLMRNFLIRINKPAKFLKIATEHQFDEALAEYFRLSKY